MLHDESTTKQTPTNQPYRPGIHTPSFGVEWWQPLTLLAPVSPAHHSPYQKQSSPRKPRTTGGVLNSNMHITTPSLRSALAHAFQIPLRQYSTSLLSRNTTKAMVNSQQSHPFAPQQQSSPFSSSTSRAAKGKKGRGIKPDRRISEFCSLFLFQCSVLVACESRRMSNHHPFHLLSVSPLSFYLSLITNKIFPYS